MAAPVRGPAATPDARTPRSRSWQRGNDGFARLPREAWEENMRIRRTNGLVVRPQRSAAASSQKLASDRRQAVASTMCMASLGRENPKAPKNFVLTGRLIAIYKVARPAGCPGGTLRATGGVAGQTWEPSRVGALGPLPLGPAAMAGAPRRGTSPTERAKLVIPIIGEMRTS